MSKWLEMSISVKVESEEQGEELADEVFAAACGGEGEGEAHVCRRAFVGSQRVVDYPDDADEHEPGERGHHVEQADPGLTEVAPGRFVRYGSRHQNTTEGES